MSTILLYTGNLFNYHDLDLETQDLGIEDIAQGLSNSSRYAGQPSRFYSISEHCFWCSHMVPSEFALEALMHDAAESVMTDLPHPLKELLPEYKAMEHRLEAAIARKYGLIFPYPPIVKEVDIRMRLTEMPQIFTCKGRNMLSSTGLEPFQIKLACWSPSEARMMFTKRYDQLTKVRHNGCF